VGHDRLGNWIGFPLAEVDQATWRPGNSGDEDEAEKEGKVTAAVHLAVEE
jgi:hypothetical protein